MRWFQPRRLVREAQLELAFKMDAGIPHPEWKPFLARVMGLDDTAQIDVELKAAVRSWVIAFADASDGDLQPFEGRRAFAVAHPSEGAQLVRLADEILDGLGAFLGGAVDIWAPLAIFKPANRDQYIDVLHHWDSDGVGETRGESAMCIFSEVPHILMPAGVDFNLGATLGHEATHACLHQHRPPAWLDEGLAQIAQEQFGGQALATMTLARKDEHLEYWNSQTIQGLWDGQAFHSVGEESSLAYEASFAIVSNMITDFRGDMAAFVAAAGGMEAADGDDVENDFGEAAAHKVFGVSLSQLAASFLGDGEWGPR